jgi:hypothetical protein
MRLNRKSNRSLGKVLDPTEPQHDPFWEFPKHLISSVRDFDV